MVGTADPLAPAARIGEGRDHAGGIAGQDLRRRDFERAIDALVDRAHAAGALVGDGDALRVPAVDLVRVMEMPRGGGVALLDGTEAIEDSEPVFEAVAGFLQRF